MNFDLAREIADFVAWVVVFALYVAIRWVATLIGWLEPPTKEEVFLLSAIAGVRVAAPFKRRY